MDDQTEIVKMLLATGADPNHQDTSAETALMLMSRLGNIAAVRELVHAGAQIDLKDKDGKTALAYAQNYLKTSGDANWAAGIEQIIDLFEHQNPALLNKH